MRAPCVLLGLRVFVSDDGIGLAAPQVGVNIQMMVFNPDGPEARGDTTKETVLINPRILKSGKEMNFYKEGCLSFYRPVHIEGNVEVWFSSCGVCSEDECAEADECQSQGTESDGRESDVVARWPPC